MVGVGSCVTTPNYFRNILVGSCVTTTRMIGVGYCAANISLAIL